MNLNTLKFYQIGKHPVIRNFDEVFSTPIAPNISILDSWKLCFPDEALELIIEGTNDKFEENLGRNKPTNKKEIIKFIASRLYLVSIGEYSYSNHWKKGKGVKMPTKELKYYRWKALHLNLKCLDLSNLFKILEDSWIHSINVGSIVTIDELVSGTRTRSPVKVYMPRKPRPNGHLIYLGAIKLNNKYPFVIAAEPFLKKGGRPTPSKTFINLCERIFPTIVDFIPQEFMVVCDSAFSTKEVLDYCLKKRINFLLSMNKYPSKPLNEILDINNDWNVGFNPSLNLSILKFNGTNSKKFKLITNHFHLNEVEDPIDQENSIIRDCYKEYFNSVDLFNKNFYSFRLKLRHFKWTQVFLDDAISMAVTNAYALFVASNPSQKILKKEFIDRLIDELLSF